MTTANSAEFDAIVVGTGPGGGTVARELSLRRKKVLILEAGGDAPVDYSLWKQARAMRMRFMGRGVSLVKGVTLGGTSMLYYASAYTPPVELFRSYGIDLSEEVEEIRRELPVGKVPDHALGPRAVRIMRSAQDLGYDWQKLDKFIFPEKCETGVPYEAKWNSRIFVREAQQNGAQLKVHSRARRVLIENGRAVGVEFREKGSPRRAFADKIVVSAGGVGSPMLLRASGIERAGEGFFTDPVIIANGTVDDIRGETEAPMMAGIHLPEDGYMMTDLTLQWYVYAALTSQVLRLDRLLAHPRTLSIMIKGQDSIGGRITESGRVRRIFPREDIEKLKHGYRRAVAILENAGARRIFRHWYVATHPGGSVRVNDVLDSDLKTEYDDLYVCDCSVIPEAWGLPPSFSLIALGKRLAKHLTR
jgi:choline dehydrogenase-like flavoprotein